jgi:pyridoxal/pyridoxine/pyridoxamine kinase
LLPAFGIGLGIPGVGVEVEAGETVGFGRSDGEETSGAALEVGEVDSSTSGAGDFFAAAFLAGAFLAGFSAAAGFTAGGYFSKNLRTTGGSTVDDAERTNSPISWSFARTSLLSIPKSFANS